MSKINIEQRDILWFFYCKFFTLRNRPVVDPKNLCRYFWLAIFGLALWVNKEMKLRWFWLIGTISLSILILPKNLLVAKILEIPAIIIFQISIGAAVIISIDRLFETLKKKAFFNWFYPVSTVFIIGAITVEEIRDTQFRHQLLQAFWETVKILPYLSVAILILVILIMIITYSIRNNYPKISRTFKTTGELITAKKSGVCPLVIPPKEFSQSNLK